MVRRTVTLSAVLGMSLAAVSMTHAEEWPRFRGADGAGVGDSDVPTEWSSTENVKWKTELPGPGFSSPIVVGDRVIVTAYSGYGVSREAQGEMEDLKRHLICVDRDNGKILWSRKIEPVLPEDPYAPPGVTAHGYASHTPVSDGERIYAFFGKTGVIAFDMQGNQLWKRSVGTGSDPREWGSAASPVLHEDLVIVNASAEDRALVALDAQTGNEVWTFKDEEGLASTWSTPVLATVNGQEELLIATPTEIWGVDPQTGELKWQASGSDARGMATSLVIGEDAVYSIGGMQGGGSVAVSLGSEGTRRKSSGPGEAIPPSDRRSCTKAISTASTSRASPTASTRRQESALIKSGSPAAKPSSRPTKTAHAAEETAGAKATGKAAPATVAARTMTTAMTPSAARAAIATAPGAAGTTAPDVAVVWEAAATAPPCSSAGRCTSPMRQGRRISSRPIRRSSNSWP